MIISIFGRPVAELTIFGRNASNSSKPACNAPVLAPYPNALEAPYPNALDDSFAREFREYNEKLAKEMREQDELIAKEMREQDELVAKEMRAQEEQIKKWDADLHAWAYGKK